MKKLLFALPLLLLLPTPVLSQYRSSQRGYSYDERCYSTEYSEEYVPGTRNNPGYIRRGNRRVEVPCERHAPRRAHVPQNTNTDNNSCIEGSIIGALLGGGLGGTISRGNGRWIGVPGGAVAGALIGCQIDGG